MRYARLATAIALTCILAAPAAMAGEPAWPSEQEAELKRVDAELLDCQRQRFAALFSKDQSAVKELNERFTKLQKERRRLLEATGRI